MIVRIPFGKYTPGTSIIHRLDPRVKLMAACIVLLTVLLIQKWNGLVPLFIIAFLGVYFSETSVQEMIRDGWTLRYFYFITILIHGFLDEGSILFSLNLHYLHLTFTYEGLSSGLFFSAKLLLMAVLMSPLLSTTHPSQLTETFQLNAQRNNLPARFFSRFLLTLGLTIRFIPIILRDAERIRWAQVSRGLSLPSGLFGKIRTLNPLLLPLFNSVINRTDVITAAMQSRGFRIDEPRSKFRNYRFKSVDLFAAALILVLLVLSYSNFLADIFLWLKI